MSEINATHFTRNLRRKSVEIEWIFDENYVFHDSYAIQNCWPFYKGDECRDWTVADLTEENCTVSEHFRFSDTIHRNKVLIRELE